MAYKTAKEPSKRDLQRQMEKTRESVSDTVSAIKETLTEQVTAAKETVENVLDYRERFKDEPLVWSLGALSAGFALGYTMGYAHKETKGSQNSSQIAAFAASIVDELSIVGTDLVMPKVSDSIKELFGFDLTEVLRSIAKAGNKDAGRKRPHKAAKRITAKTSARTRAKLPARTRSKTSAKSPAATAAKTSAKTTAKTANRKSA